MSPEIMRVDAETIGALEGKPVLFPTLAYVGVEDGEVCAAWGLAWYLSRCWVWYGLVDTARTHPMYVIRQAKRMLKTAEQLGEQRVFCWRDDHPLSAKLLKKVGMDLCGVEKVTFADGTKGTREVWSKWLGPVN